MALGNRKNLRRQRGKPALSDELIARWFDANKAAEKGNELAAAEATELLSEAMRLIRAGRLAASPLKAVVHKDSVLYELADLCERHSFTSAEIPIWSVLCMTGYLLARKGVAMQTPGYNPVPPLLFTTIFGDSSARKSDLSKKIIEAVGLDPNRDLMPVADTTEAQRDMLIATNGHATQLFDEDFGQHNEQARPGKKLDGYSALICAAYDGFVRKNLVSEQSSSPVNCGLLGFAQTKLVMQQFAPSDWHSGYLPRMTLVVAPPLSRVGLPSAEIGRRYDPSELSVAIKQNGCLERWAAHIRAVQPHPAYQETRAATLLLQDRMARWVEAIGVDGPFVVRGQFAARKLALILHVLYMATDKNGDAVLTAEDMAGACDIIEQAMHSIKFLAEAGNMSLHEQAFQAAEEYYVNLADKSQFTYRNLVQNSVLRTFWNRGLGCAELQLIIKGIVTERAHDRVEHLVEHTSASKAAEVLPFAPLVEKNALSGRDDESDRFLDEAYRIANSP